MSQQFNQHQQPLEDEGKRTKQDQEYSRVPMWSNEDKDDDPAWDAQIKVAQDSHPLMTTNRHPPRLQLYDPITATTTTLRAVSTSNTTTSHTRPNTNASTSTHTNTNTSTSTNRWNSSVRSRSPKKQQENENLNSSHSRKKLPSHFFLSSPKPRKPKSPTHHPTQKQPSYWNLLRYNRSYRFFLLSHLLTLTGEWFTYVASISLLEQQQQQQQQQSHDDNNNIHTETGLFILIWLIPNILFAPLGGILADSTDRRKSILRINILASLITTGYLIACSYHSIVLIYIITFLRQSCGALYQPCKSSIVPMIISHQLQQDRLLLPQQQQQQGQSQFQFHSFYGKSHEEEDIYSSEEEDDHATTIIRTSSPHIDAQEEGWLKKATTLSGFLWATMATTGSALGGLTVSKWGIQACFFIDSCAYLLSAMFMYCMGGTWTTNPSEEKIEKTIQGQDGSVDTLSRPHHPNKNCKKKKHKNKVTNRDEYSQVKEEDDDDSQDSEETDEEADNDDDFVDKMTLSTHKIWNAFRSMTVDGILYLQKSFFGPLILLKFSAASIYGSLTVLQVSFSEFFSSSDRYKENQNRSFSYDDPDQISRTSAYFGILLGCTGLGAFIGTFLVDRLANVNHAKSLQKGCIWGYLFMALGYFVMATIFTFPSVCICSTIIYIALTVIWIQSDLIFQIFASSDMMGRVTAVDFALATMSEGVSSFIVGFLQDHLHLSVQKTCLIMAYTSLVVFLAWYVFHSLGKGAAAHDTNDMSKSMKKKETLTYPRKDEEEWVDNLGHFVEED